MRLHRILLLATLLTGAIALFWGLGSIPLLSFNEARRGIPASTMLATGDWLLPRLNGDLYLSKPPLLYWLIAMVSYLLEATNEWAVRLPSALAATAILATTYCFSRRQFGNQSAWFAVQILIANTTFAMFARRAEIEMVLTALCFGSLLAALQYTRGNRGKRWLWLSYFLLGLATLTKGPLALLFVTLPLLADALYHREPRQWQALRDPVGWLIFLAVGSSWFVAVTWRMGFDIWQSIVQKDIVNKVSESSGDPFYTYILWLIADFFPASLLLLAAPLATWRSWRSHQPRITLLLAVATPLIVFSVFGNKHTKYLLPAYPLIAIILGKRLGELFEASGPVMRRLILAASLLFPAGYAVFYAAVESRVFEYRYVALLQFAEWLPENRKIQKAPLYGYVDLDERLIYYAKRDIPILDKKALDALRAAKAPMLLLVEGDRIAETRSMAECSVKEFKPYLKKGKSLTVLGFGSACAIFHDANTIQPRS